MTSDLPDRLRDSGRIFNYWQQRGLMTEAADRIDTLTEALAQAEEHRVKHLAEVVALTADRQAMTDAIDEHLGAYEHLADVASHIVGLTEQLGDARVTLDALAGCDVCRVCAGIAADWWTVSDSPEMNQRSRIARPTAPSAT